MVHPALVCLLLAPFAAAITRNSLYKPNSLDQEHQLPRDDDVSSPEIKLNVPIVFYGEKFTTIFVNSNGLLSFQTEIPTFFNIQFPLNYPVIAPLYSNVDVRPSGTISYYETGHGPDLQKITDEIQDNFFDEDFKAQSLFVATWTDVGYYDQRAEVVNTYQVAIASDGHDSYAEFLYPEDGIQWIQGSGKESGLPDARAQSGLISSNGTLFTLKGSGTDQVKNLEWTSNMNEPGKWLFRIGKVSEVVEPTIKLNLDENSSVQTGTCAEESSQCHSQSKCFDFNEGFCCVCHENYYGNGKTCIKNDVPMRVNGKLNGNLNGFDLDQLVLQSYVVMVDGRTYTAISKIPREIGYSTQTLQILGSLIGFLFAKPVNGIKNGYQITGGVFAHSANIHFLDTNDRIQITQTFYGLDVFDQLRLEINVQGTVPNIPVDAKFTLPKYEERYTMTTPGVLASSATHQYQFGDQVHEYTIDQIIKYEACVHLPLENPAWSYKVFKTFISYENTEQILRFGMSSKVTPLGEIDPCKEGRHICGPDSSCVVDGDTFQCVCDTGYQAIYNERNQAICVDINECQVGLHNCDLNAQCINEPGSFSCRCNAGYEEDGHYCRERSCDTLACGENAECVEDDVVHCMCRYGFSGDGLTCDPNKRIACNTVNNCSPYGYCSISDPNDPFRPYECQCQAGFYGDGYVCERMDDPTTLNGTDEHTTPTDQRVPEQCSMDSCWCPLGYSKEDGTAYCKPEANEELTGNPIEQNDSCNVINDCHPNAQCVLIPHTGAYECICNVEYEGDGYNCVMNNVSCVNSHTCDIHASCVYDQNLHKSVCMCNQGYLGDGMFCEAKAQCRSHKECNQNEYCAFVTTTYECVCMDGYVKDAEDVCKKLVDTCGGGTCVENAQCLFDEGYQTHYCECYPEFVGDGITECKPRPIGCNVKNNCGLYADCVHDWKTSIYQCQCIDGYFGDGFICTSQKTCQIDPYICDAHASCVVDQDRQYVCLCNEGYTGNGTVCKISPKHEGNFLLLNQGMATLRVPFVPTPKNPGKPIQIQYYQVAIGLDVDCYEGRVYWGDITGRAVKSSNYNGTNYTDSIKDDVGSPEGLSIDWVSRNIYWTDSTKHTIEVANLESKLRKTLFSDGLTNPRGIAVHPQRGKMFWSDWNRRGPKIEWANMDGSGREIFLQGSNVHLPNSIAIDWDTDEVCFADAGTHSIECVNIDTKIVRTIATNCEYPFGLAVSEDHYYWTDWNTQKIESVNKQSLLRQPPIKVPLGGTGNKLYGIVAVPEQCLGLINACQFYNGQCPPGHICMPNDIGRRSCVCADDQKCRN